MTYFPLGQKIFLGFIFFFGITNSMNGQEEDFQSWNMISISKKLKPEYTTSLTAIYRINDNASKFSDISFDWRLTRKFRRGFSAQIAFRNWTFLQKKPVYFLWYDLVYVNKSTKYKWVNLLRIHHGLDWVGRQQADFIRMRNHLFYNIDSKNKLATFIGYDIWYRLNQENRFQTIWLEAGIEYTIEKLKFRLNYRRIDFFNDGPGLRRNMIVTGIFYKI